MADASRAKKTANLAAEAARVAASEIRQMCFNALEQARVFLVGEGFPTKRLIVVEDAIFCEIPQEDRSVRTAKMVHKRPAMPTAMEEHELEPPGETVESIQFAVTAEVAMVIAQRKVRLWLRGEVKPSDLVKGQTPPHAVTEEDVP